MVALVVAVFDFSFTALTHLSLASRQTDPLNPLILYYSQNRQPVVERDGLMSVEDGCERMGGEGRGEMCRSAALCHHLHPNREKRSPYSQPSNNMYRIL